MTTCKYSGDQERVYPQFLDTGAQAALAAQPGGTYEVELAAGNSVTVPPADGRWAVVLAASEITSVPARAIPGAFVPGYYDGGSVYMGLERPLATPALRACPADPGSGVRSFARPVRFYGRRRRVGR